MINSAEEFKRLRESSEMEEYHRAAHDEAPLAVWREVIATMPEMRFWVAQNKTVPVEILEILHTGPLESVRSMVARKRKLPLHLQQALAKDPEVSVRIGLIGNAKLADSVLRELAADQDEFVRESALGRLERESGR